MPSASRSSLSMLGKTAAQEKEDKSASGYCGQSGGAGGCGSQPDTGRRYFRWAYPSYIPKPRHLDRDILGWGTRRKSVDFTFIYDALQGSSSGPIERGYELLPQLKRHTPSTTTKPYGLKLIAWGAFLKLVIADHSTVAGQRAEQRRRNRRPTDANHHALPIQLYAGLCRIQYTWR